MTKKTKLIPFDWEKYRAGAKAIYRNESMEILFVYRSFLDETYQIHAIFRTENGGSEITRHTVNGQYIYNDAECSSDLMLEEKVEEKTFYVNVSQNIYLYNSLEEAREESIEGCKKFIKVTYTDEDLIK